MLQEAVHHIGPVEDKLVKAQIAGRKVNENYTKDAMERALQTKTSKQASVPWDQICQRCKMLVSWFGL